MPNPVINKRAGRVLVKSTPAGEWAARVVANGGAMPGATTINALNTFDAALVSAGLKSRIYHMNIIAPDSFIAMRTPYIVGTGFGLWVRHDFGPPVVSDETLTINGWTPGVDRFHCRVYDTGFVPSTVAAFNSGNGGISIYCSDVSIVSKGGEICGGYDGTRYFAMQPDVTGFNDFFANVWDVAHNIDVVGPDHHGYFFMVSRSATNVFKAYRAHSTSAWAQYGATQTAVNASGPLTSTCYCGGAWYSGTSSVNSTCNMRQSFHAYHDGLSSADGQTFFNAVQALRVAIGGGYL